MTSHLLRRISRIFMGYNGVVSVPLTKMTGGRKKGQDHITVPVPSRILHKKTARRCETQRHELIRILHATCTIDKVQSIWWKLARVLIQKMTNNSFNSWPRLEKTIPRILFLVNLSVTKTFMIFVTASIWTRSGHHWSHDTNKMLLKKCIYDEIKIVFRMRSKSLLS